MRDNILSQISELSHEDKSRLYKVIEGFLFDIEVDITKEQDKEKRAIANNCPHCASTKTRKNGHQYGVQRFVCNACKKNFRVSTGSVTAHLKKKELLKVYIPHMFAGYSLEKCAKLTGISKQTSFDCSGWNRYGKNFGLLSACNCIRKTRCCLHVHEGVTGSTC